jgi:hypothetical protein
MWMGDAARLPLVIILFLMSFYMIRNVRFPKPVWYISQTFVIAAVASIYLYLHFTGVFVP